MSRRINFDIGEYYHVYNRGTDKRDIFVDDYDRDRFIFMLYALNTPASVEIRNLLEENISGGPTSVWHKRDETIVDIGAWCLMPNHFHILLHENIEGGVSKFMQKLMTAYTMYFNARNSRSGHLFQGRFKAEHVSSDPYLEYLFAYIHLNPIKIIDPKWKDKKRFTLMRNFYLEYRSNKGKYQRNF